MKTASMLAVAAFSVVPLLSLAQTVPDVDSQITISGIGVPRHPYPMDIDEFHKFKGSYDLANGETLSLFNRGPAMYAKVGDREWHRIVAANHNTFVAKDHLMKIRLDLQENGDATGELLLAKR